MATNDWVPRKVYEKQITVLIDRCTLAEGCVKALINFIAEDNGEFLASSLHDWYAATKDLVGKL